MRLTDRDKECLKIWGYLERDMKQIEEAMRKTVYKINHKRRISAKKASKLLEREAYLSGLSRSAFHWSASRDIGDSGNTVSFDSSSLFQESGIDLRRKELL